MDTWAGSSSGGSFWAVAQVSVWGLGLLLRESLVDYGNSPDNANSQGGKELNGEIQLSPSFWYISAHMHYFCILETMKFFERLS